MKNIIKNIITNNKGSAKLNVIKGLSVAVFATVIIYGVYTSYNNSPAYNPARRAIFVGEGNNLNVNSIDGGFDTIDGIPESMRSEYGKMGGFKNSAVRGGTSVKSRIRKGEAEFESARAYMDAQKAAAANGAQSGVVDGADYVLNGETNPMLTAQGGVRNSYNREGSVVQGYNAGGAQTGQEAQDLEKAKNAKTQKSSEQRTPTVVNKLAPSSGSSSVASGAKSSGSGFSGSSFGGSVNYDATKAGRDSSAQPLSSINLAKAKDAGAFKAGRGGTMGGHNVGYSAGTEAAPEKGRGSDSKSDLNVAFAHSRKGAASVYKAGEKGQAEAAAAFDGSETSSGGEIGGDQVVNPGGDRDLGNGLNDGRFNDDFRKFNDDIISDTERQDSLIYAGTTHFIQAILTALAAIYLISLLRELAKAHPLWWAAIALVTFAAIYTLWFADYDGNGKTIAQDMSELYKLNDKLGASNWESWAGWLVPLLGVFTAGIGAAVIWGDKIAGKLGLSSFAKNSWLGGGVTGLATTQILSDVKVTFQDLIVNNKKK